MSEWPKFNPDRHGPLQHSVAGPFRHCSCGLNCLESKPCLCCLAAEVERITADITDHWLPMGEALAAEVEALRAQVRDEKDWRLAAQARADAAEEAAEECTEVIAELKSQVQRVRELHPKGPHETCLVCATWEEWQDGRSDLLGMPYPCPTIRALDGGSDE